MQSEFNSEARIELEEEFNLLLQEGTDEQRAQFLRGLHESGERPEQVTILAALLRERAKLSPVTEASDIVGTGGDGMNTINVSTAASILLSSTGIRIAKHGNFGATSNKGSADFLKYLGYQFEMEQDNLEERLRDSCFAFILAPMYNSSFAKFAGARKMLPFKTVFNYLGPLTNPADPSVMMLGVTSRSISELYTNYLLLNSKAGCVVFSDDGMDEISPVAGSNINFVNGGKVEEVKFDPSGLLRSKVRLSDISRKEAEPSFKLTLAGLEGKNMPASEFISLNAAVAMFVNGKFPTVEDAYGESMRLLKSGYVGEHLRNIVEGRR